MCESEDSLLDSVSISKENCEFPDKTQFVILCHNKHLYPLSHLIVPFYKSLWCLNIDFCKRLCFIYCNQIKIFTINLMYVYEVCIIGRHTCFWFHKCVKARGWPLVSSTIAFHDLCLLCTVLFKLEFLFIYIIAWENNS